MGCKICMALCTYFLYLVFLLLLFLLGGKIFDILVCLFIYIKKYLVVNLFTQFWGQPCYQFHLNLVFIFCNSNPERKKNKFMVTETVKFKISSKPEEEGFMHRTPSKTGQDTCSSTWNELCTTKP